jgi:hypothetical protein
MRSRQDGASRPEHAVDDLRARWVSQGLDFSTLAEPLYRVGGIVVNWSGRPCLMLLSGGDTMEVAAALGGLMLRLVGEFCLGRQRSSMRSRQAGLDRKDGTWC